MNKLVPTIILVAIGAIILPTIITLSASISTEDYELGDEYKSGNIIYFLQEADYGYDAEKRLALVVYNNHLGSSQWGCRGGLIGINPENSGTVDTFGYGQENTENIIESHDSWDVIAGPSCHVAGDGTVSARRTQVLSHYHLPSREEMAIVYNNRHHLNIPNLVYWTSSEVDAYDAWARNFSSGAEESDFKSIENYVLPVGIMDVQGLKSVGTLTSLLPYIVIVIIIVAIGTVVIKKK